MMLQKVSSILLSIGLCNGFVGTFNRFLSISVVF